MKLKDWLVNGRQLAAQNMLSPQEKIAKILRVDKKSIEDLERRLTATTGKADVLEKIVTENGKYINDRLLILGVPRQAGAREVYDALISKVDSDEHRIFEYFNNPDCRNQAACQSIAETARKLAGQPSGFFLKLEKAREFLLKEPPRQVMSFLSYNSAEEMLAQEDLLEIYSSLRFIEGNDWLNNVFFKQYQSLQPSDFEIRTIQVRALNPKWGKEAEKFVLKKKHNISHLKELGVVFIIPVMLGIDGEILRMFVLLMHYLHEIPFYSSVFQEIAKKESGFSKNFISLLRGDVVDQHFASSGKFLWLVVQRYLSKDDENDWRLFAPHINPEAIHWQKAEENLADLGKELNGFSGELRFWTELDWVGDFFRDDSGVDILVSFNLVDTVMSLVKEKEMVKYLYHHQEALWNKIFSEYFGEEQLEKFAQDYLLQGYFEV